MASPWEWTWSPTATQRQNLQTRWEEGGWGNRDLTQESWFQPLNERLQGQTSNAEWQVWDPGYQYWEQVYSRPEESQRDAWYGSIGVYNPLLSWEDRLRLKAVIDSWFATPSGDTSGGPANVTNTEWGGTPPEGFVPPVGQEGGISSGAPGTPSAPQPEGETVPEVTEWWREQGFESYEDWYNERWLPYVEALNGLMAERPDMPDFSGIYGGIADLAGQIANPSATWGAEADAFTARMLGFESPEAYQTWLQEQRGKTTEDFRMSPEQRAALEKEQRASERQIAEQGRLRAEAAFGASGGMLAKMSQAMDEANATIYDERARFQADLIATDFANAIAQLQANNDYMMRSIEQGTATYGQYIQMQEQGAAAALQNYYNQAALMLDEYDAEWQGVLNQAKLIADAAALAMGTEETILALINQRYEQSLAPFVDAQTFEINEATLEQIYAAIEQGNWELLVQLITGVLAGIGDIIPG